MLYKDSNTSNELELYQYTEWPDKGVPDEAETLLTIIEKINADYVELTSPMLVFCK
jgi:protein tyrosine phosphatase